MGMRLLFVCSGNTCRSPMAEALLRAALPDGSGWTVESAGISAENGVPASRNAVAAMRELGMDISGHLSRKATREMLSSADVVVAMTRSHRARLVSLDPGVEQKSFLMLDFHPGQRRIRDMEDPIGGAISAYRACRDLILECMPDLVDCLATLGKVQQDES